jgi:hypothetical protein
VALSLSQSTSFLESLLRSKSVCLGVAKKGGRFASYQD